MQRMKRAAVSLAVVVLALLALPAGALQAPVELPKGVFPGGVPPVTPTPAPRPEPAPPPAPRAEPAPAPEQAGVGDPARDQLGRVAVPPAAPVTDLAGVLTPAAQQALRARLIEF